MRSKLMIVVADDDLDDQDLIKNAFADAKIPVQIIPAYDGVQLLDYLLRRYKYSSVKDPLPDVIFMDLNMPLMDGFESLKEIKSQSTLKNIPLYVVTTSRREEHKLMAKKLGASGFYSKGATSKEIGRIVREICFDCFNSEIFSDNR